MSRQQVEEGDLKKHPTNPGWTMPKSWGVWELPIEARGDRYRYGNYPVRGIELEREFGIVKRLGLYTSRKFAKDHAAELNLDDQSR